MKKSQQQQQKLQEILTHQKFEELEPFKSIKTWKTLTSDDRDLLASLFVMRGEQQQDKDDPNAEESFDLAVRVSPQNPSIFYRVGCAYAKQTANLKALNLAVESFLKALELDSLLIDPWISLANTYSAIGDLSHEMESFHQAEEIFEKISKEIDASHISWTTLHWYWAKCNYFIGKQSGEVVDYFKALQKFRKAATGEGHNHIFWCMYGDTLDALSCLVSPNYFKTDVLFEIIELYRHSVKQSFNFYEGWHKLGGAYQRLFEVRLDENAFRQAEECYRIAADLNDSDAILWYRWGVLEATYGRVYRQQDVLEESLSKFEKATICHPDQPSILCAWAKILLYCGSATESLHLINEAQQKILKSLELDPQSVEGWCSYGHCLVELGHYFGAQSYFLEAIGKFQYGLHLKEKDPYLCYGLALAYAALGDANADLSSYEEAVVMFAKAEISNSSFVEYRQYCSDWGVTLMKLVELTNEKQYLLQALEKFQLAVGDLKTPHLDPEWIYNYGCALDFMGDFDEDIDCYEEAIQVLNKALELSPEYSHARYNLALAYAHLGEAAMDVESFHKAIENFQLLIGQDNEDEMAWTDYGLTLIHLAQLIYDPSRPENSLKLYQVAENKLLYATSLGSTQAYYHLACLYSLVANYELALHFLEKAESAETLPSLDALLQDVWLEGLRNTPGFRQFISHFPKQSKYDD